MYCVVATEVKILAHVVLLLYYVSTGSESIMYCVVATEVKILAHVVLLLYYVSTGSESIMYCNCTKSVAPSEMYIICDQP